MSKKNLNVEGLEVQSVDVMENAEKQVYTLEYLKANTPEFPENFCSKKLKLDREPSVQAGLQVMNKISGESINSLLLLLGAWWENKEARKVIKRAIDDEARSKGMSEVEYLQQELRDQFRPFEALQDAVERLKYAITYFKPRPGKEKETYIRITIDEQIWIAPQSKVTEFKQLYGHDRETLIEKIKEVSTLDNIVEI